MARAKAVRHARMTTAPVVDTATTSVRADRVRKVQVPVTVARKALAPMMAVRVDDRTVPAPASRSSHADPSGTAPARCT